MEDTFIKQRLDALYDVDCKIVSLLDNLSLIFQTCSTPPSDASSNSSKEQFVEQTKSMYSMLGDIAIILRKEVKTMDDNIGVYDKNKDNVMILPIAVDQKNTRIGRQKLEEELRSLDKLVLDEEVKVKIASEDKETEKEKGKESVQDDSVKSDIQPDVKTEDVEMEDVKMEDV